MVSKDGYKTVTKSVTRADFVEETRRMAAAINVALQKDGAAAPTTETVAPPATEVKAETESSVPTPPAEVKAEAEPPPAPKAVEPAPVPTEAADADAP